MFASLSEAPIDSICCEQAGADIEKLIPTASATNRIEDEIDFIARLDQIHRRRLDVIAEKPFA